jgi:transposase, IS5 family
MSRTRDPQWSFADLEFLSQNIQLEPVLQAISDFIGEQAELVEKVRRDLASGLKKPHTGRPGLTAQQTLRSLTLMRVKNWDYRELRERIADGYTLRRFTDFHSQSVPKHDAFHRAFNQLTPATLQAVNEAVVRAAVRVGLEDGQKLRADTTVVETDIHHPTDNTLLWDSVRVVTRLVQRLMKRLPTGSYEFTNRTRSARRRMLQIQRMTSKERGRSQAEKYRQLIGITEQVVAEARGVLQKTQKVRGVDSLTGVTIQSLRGQIQHYMGLADRVIDQSRRRVLEGQPVANAQKVFSIFEPHTDLIKRGKVLKDIEFGHKVFLAESACGLITQYQVLDGNPSDQDQVEAALDRHQKTFRRCPELCSLDRGFFSEKNVELCRRAGVKIVCIPQCGGQKTPQRQAFENSPVFKKGQRFRAGIEGRISVLFRGRGMKRCLAEGRQRFQLLVGAAVLANNLMVIAQLLIQKQKRRRHAA